MLADAGGDRMARVDRPQPLAFARLAPLQRAGCAHQPLEDFGEMAGMQHEQAHAFPDAPGDTLDDHVGDGAMILVAPPGQDIGLGKPGFAQPMLRLLQRRRRRRDGGITVQRIGNRRVHALGVDAADDLIGILVDVFTPHNGANGHVVFSLSLKRIESWEEHRSWEGQAACMD